MGAMAGRLKGAFAAMGGAMVISGIIDKFDRIGKLAARFDVTAETLQKLGHVAQIGGADLETVAKAMKTLNTSAAEAKGGMATYVREFDTLGIKVDDFFKLNHEQRWLAIADAVKNATDRNAAMAAITKLMGRAGAEVFTILEQGGAATREMMDSITVASDETVKAIEEINDKMTELKTLTAGTFANLFVGLIEGAVEVGEIIGKSAAIIETKLPLWALASPALWLNPAVWAGHGLTRDGATTGEILAGMREGDGEQGSWSDIFGSIDALQKREAEKHGPDLGIGGKSYLKLMEGHTITMLQSMMMRGQAEWEQSGWPARAKEAFAEDPFKDINERSAQRLRDALGMKDDEPSKAMTAGRFSEFVQTAGLGGTGYLRKTPALVQLEKQTKLTESMARSLDEFNSSLDDLVDNTVDR